MTRVLCVDDDATMRTYLDVRLGLEPDVMVVGQAVSAGEAMTVLRQEPVDVILLDYQLEGATGFQFLEVLGRDPHGAEAAPRVLFCTGLADAAFEAEARALGAAGVLPKEALAEQLLPALRSVAAGETWFPLGPKSPGAAERLQANVLVAEDEHGIRQLLRCALAEFGCTVSLAWRGEDVLRQLEAEHFDLLLLDHQLAGRLLGTELLGELGERWPKLPVLFLTGLPSAVEPHLSHPSVCGVVSKPFHPQRLRDAIAAALPSPLAPVPDA